jgi:hypothetical protein
MQEIAKQKRGGAKVDSLRRIHENRAAPDESADFLDGLAQGRPFFVEPLIFDLP